MKTEALLFIPNDATMLAEGVCGARLPILARAEGLVGSRNGAELWVDTGWCPDWKIWQEQRNQERALVLAYHGDPVREGRDRLVYALAVLEDLQVFGVRAPWFDVARTAVDLYGHVRWTLSDEVHYSAQGNVTREPWMVAALASPPAWAPRLIPVWALGVCCEARGLGRLVFSEVVS